MKKLILFVAFSAFIGTVSAQSYKETFDTNSLDWTECGYKNGIGTAIIDKGVMTVTSKGDATAVKILNIAAGNGKTKIQEDTFFETHCYAPIDVQKPFEIRSTVNIKQLVEDRLVGLVFNYRDGGNFYCFTFNNQFIQFRRYEDSRLVGQIMQGIRGGGKRHSDMVWTLVSDGHTLVFKVDDTVMMTIRYMPLSYSGFGYYTFGNQELIIDEVEFIQ